MKHLQKILFLSVVLVGFEGHAGPTQLIRLAEQVGSRVFGSVSRMPVHPFQTSKMQEPPRQWQQGGYSGWQDVEGFEGVKGQSGPSERGFVDRAHQAFFRNRKSAVAEKGMHFYLPSAEECEHRIAGWNQLAKNQEDSWFTSQIKGVSTNLFNDRFGTQALYGAGGLVAAGFSVIGSPVLASATVLGVTVLTVGDQCGVQGCRDAKKNLSQGLVNTGFRSVLSVWGWWSASTTAA